MTDISRTPDNPDNPPLDTIDYEAEARRMGWRGEADYSGDPAKFVDAKTFYERGKDRIPLLQASLSRTQQELSRVKANATEALAIAERAHEREVADLREQLTQAKTARSQAVASSDGEAFARAEGVVEEIEGKLADAARNKPRKPVEIDPRFEAWMADNPWYTSNPVLQATADTLSFHPTFAHLKGQGEKFWNAIKEAMKQQGLLDRVLPNREDLERPGPARGGRGSDNAGGGGGTPPKRSYENLTPEYKKVCDTMGRDFGKMATDADAKKWRDRYVSGCSDDAFRS